jgi:hypothetical protein
LAAVAVTFGLVFLAPGTSRAAVTLGEVTPPGGPLGCNQGSFIVQTGTSGSREYRVPAGGGVITEWSAKTWPGGTSVLQLALFGSSVDNDEVTFEALSGFESIGPVSEIVTKSFKTRVPVKGGERLGLYGLTGLYTCAYGFKNGPGNRIIWGNIPAPPTIGAPPVLASNGDVMEERVPVEAKLEPDADHDNFGDETQDQCPTNATTQGPCPSPDTAIVKHPKAKTKNKKATFQFSSTILGATFECQLDNGPFLPCTSPYQARVGKGKHSFAVRATVKGLADASPATFRWKVMKKKRHHPRHR